MRSNMQNIEELCIKYLMDELDPSEKILVEKKMREDPNILIEIESLRCTLNKLDDLPVYSPPAEVAQALVDLARDNKNTAVTPIPLLGNMAHNVRYWGAAAVLVLSVSVGSYFIFSNGSQSMKVSTQTINTAMNSQSAQSNQTVKPWVDKNNIIYITPTNSSQVASVNTDTALSGSMKNLKPLKNPVLNQDQSLDLHLAGSKQEQR